jgi:hypothetical protein
MWKMSTEFERKLTALIGKEEVKKTKKLARKLICDGFVKEEDMDERMETVFADYSKNNDPFKVK